MNFLKPLDDITPSDLSLVGGKPYNCARLKQAGFPVPDGVAVTAETKESAAALAELHAWLNTLPEDSLFAARSSAADEDNAGHSFAGLHETILNVTHAGIESAARACWASVESPQALAPGLIVEVCGTLSPASTAAREYGLPALANLKDATKLFRDGDHVQLDATNGVVRLLTRPRAPQ